MEKRANIGFSVLFLLGIIYTILGGSFVIFGTVMYLLIPKDSQLISLIFGGIGGIFFVLGVIFLVIHIKKQQLSDELLVRGNYIVGEVTDLVRNYNIRIMGIVPYIAIVKYRNSAGNVHVFKTRNLYKFPDKDILGLKVKVYVEDESYKHYYVDIDEILPKVIVH